MDTKSAFIILMILSFLGINALSFYVRPAKAIIWIEGHIASDTTWAPVDTYRVINNTYVDPGVTLTILPGVQVQFADGFSLIVHGSLNATGTEVEPIILTSSRTTPDSGAWNTIKFEGDLSEQFVIRHAKVEYAVNGITIQSLGSATIKQNYLSNCSESGIYVVGESNVLIRQNLIQHNNNGITTDKSSTHSGITIIDNTIASCEGNGIYMRSQGHDAFIYNVTIESNDISTNVGYAILFDSQSSHISYSEGEGQIYDVDILSNSIKSNGKGISMNSHGEYRGIGFIYDVTFSSNIISENGGTGIYIYSYGGYTQPYGGNSYIYNIDFTSNEISSNMGDAIGIFSYGDDHYGKINNITISSNTISGNSGNGINMLGKAYYSSYVYDVTIQSNTVSSNTGDGILLEAYGQEAHSNIYNTRILSNTVVANNATGICMKSDVSHHFGGNGRSYLYNADISDNTISFNNESGIYLYIKGRHGGYISNSTILSNSVFLNAKNGIHMYSLGGQFGDVGYLYNVTLSFNSVLSNVANGIYAVSELRDGQLLYDLGFLNNTVSANDQKGVWIDGQINANLTYNSIAYNEGGVLFSTLNNLANYNDLYRNSYGMNVTDGGTVNAEHNYWGHSTGPYHASLNPEGEGNTVNGNGIDLDFIPFLTDPVGTVNQRPVAILEVNKTNPNLDETVTFDASESADDGRIDYYFFDFGDGTNSSWTPLSVVPHNYASEGTYNAILRVMDDFGVSSTNTAMETITVSAELPSLIASLSFTQTTVESDKDISVSVHVTDGTLSVGGAYVQLVSDKGGTFTPTLGYTNTNGDFTATFKAPTISEQTNVRITATASKSGYNDGSDYEYVTVVPPGVTPPTLSVTVTANPTTIQSSQTSTITTRVVHGSTPISEATITLSLNGGGALSATSGNTDSNGYFTTTFTALTVTTQTTNAITAIAAKTGYLNGQDQTQITVNPAQSQPQQPDLTLWIYIGVAVIVLAGLGGGIAIARRRSRRPKQ